METRLRRENNGLAADEPGKSAATNASRGDPNVIAAEGTKLAQDHPFGDITEPPYSTAQSDSSSLFHVTYLLSSIATIWPAMDLSETSAYSTLALNPSMSVQGLRSLFGVK